MLYHWRDLSLGWTKLRLENKKYRMQILSKFKERSSLYKIVVIFLFSLLLLNSVVYYIQPFTSSSIFEYYTKGYFSFVSSIQHVVFGIAPISFGDIFYILIATYLIFQFLNLIFSLLTKRFKKLPNTILNITFPLLFIWLLLGSQWNWNYLQPSIEEKMNLDTSDIKIEKLAKFTSELIKETTKNKESSNFDIFDDSTNSIIDISHLGYKVLAKENEFYNYKYPSVKYSLLSPILPFIGISGYYNPFTAEAQITKGMPVVLIPFVTNHEIAHQLGIASEAEANFIGYLASINNPLSTVKYSGNLRLLIYCLSELRYREYENYDVIKKSISPEIKKDINDIYSYWNSHKSIFNEYQSIIYDKFLKSNNQKDGLESYNKVVSLAIFYNRKK